MKRRLKLLWVVMVTLAVLALLVTASGCAKNVTQIATATATVSKTTTTTLPSPSPSITTSAAAPPAPSSAQPPPPVASAPPPPASNAQPAASPKPPAPGGAPPPPAGGAQPPPPGGAPPPPPGGAPPSPPGGAVAAPASPSMSGKMVLTSSVVKEGGSLGDAYTCNGVTSGTFAVPKSPPLTWTGAPAGTKSFVVILSGIRGGGDEGIMLLVYNIPGTATGLPEGLKDNLVDPKIGTIGSTDRGVIGYTPPCGGSSGPWLKTFTLYALSTTPEVFDDPKFVNAPAIRASMKSITLDAAQLNFNVVIK